MIVSEATAMTRLAPIFHDSGAMRGKRVILGGQRSFRHVLFQERLTLSRHNPILKAIAKRMQQRGKLHKLLIVAIARCFITVANVALEIGLQWRISSAA